MSEEFTIFEFIIFETGNWKSVFVPALACDGVPSVFGV